MAKALARREAFEALTEQQRVFVEEFTKTGDATAARDLAGYSEKTNPVIIMAGPTVQAAISAWCDARLNGDLKHKALSVLEELLDKGPAATRFQAAKLILEETKPEERKGDRPMTEMSLAELEALVRAKEDALKPATPENGASQPQPLDGPR